MIIWRPYKIPTLLLRFAFYAALNKDRLCIVFIFLLNQFNQGRFILLPTKCDIITHHLANNYHSRYKSCLFIVTVTVLHKCSCCIFTSLIAWNFEGCILKCKFTVNKTGYCLRTSTYFMCVGTKLVEL